MQKLYQKSEINFAIFWIVIYVVGTSIADTVSETIGITKIITVVFHILLSVLLLTWTGKYKLYEKYGLCKPRIQASKFLYYIPLMVLATCNLWLGVALNLSVTESALYICSMICVGFLEELIFRGFLFKAMSKNNIKSAIIVSSITFGIGHIINLINGSGADLIANICQICYAIAIGYMFVIIFYRGKSLLPCIITHMVFNSLSVFAKQENWNNANQIIVSIIICAIAITYTFILQKTLPKAELNYNLSED